MSVLVQDVLEDLVKLGVVIQGQVIVLRQVLWFPAEGTHRLADVLIRHHDCEEICCAFLSKLIFKISPHNKTSVYLTTFMITMRHLHDLLERHGPGAELAVLLEE